MDNCSPTKLSLIIILMMIITSVLSVGCECSSEVDIMKILKDGKTYNIFPGLLEASAVLKSAKGRGGVTVFAPVDQAFLGTRHFQSLRAPEKTNIIGLHILPAYIPLGKFKSFIDPVHPTLTTAKYGAETFTLNITKINGSVISVQSSLVDAQVTHILYQRKPVAVFGISKLLLPVETYDKKDEL